MTRTTISLHESTLSRVKQVARHEHKSLGETITELLNLGLQKLGEVRSARRKRIKLPKYSMGVPRVALEDKEALYAVFDEKARGT